MEKIHAAITGIGAFLPEYRLTNDELSTMVETSDEWIMQRIGIKERRIYKEPGKATSDMGTAAVKQLLEKTNTLAEEIDLLICATITSDRLLPATANVISRKAGLKNAWSFDINAACSGFVFALTTASQFVESGRYKKVIVVGADMMSSITNYSDRTTCPLFGDGAAAVLLEPTTETLGVIDHINYTDGKGRHYLHMKAGGSKRPASHETIDNLEHFVHQDGQTVFKYAVSRMADVAVEIMQKNQIKAEELAWLVPHQANMRIIEAVARRMDIDRGKVMINIEKYGNTTAATIPLCLYDYENQLKKGDNIIMAAFGAGFTWGAVYLKWAY
ncbi:MAG: 3-oxoacyl-ACP synthase [Bacteroidetes bacterium GWF2_42_66]|nr:MAG: 3-oxoacyl-ACP synthase [Bacteroidetes bacterium GWA2_42_15]OFY02898.1 MAG: 3-oxoacyl-ACP synthase [Bacteroidetes bacterium GWE2_42_39]OFY44553.1 MAG: 3-oxoacyl-ACP synthase [Bacteroidetes bacterium GWF2_42_66]HBL74889.1 3-oxoacyl-ACP synthase [Prolixibacteraceae bacterium]HCR91738.1 3-oxoacyl-ACP synthase [Prolixibacteraceae bacterium]